jgi:nicotinamide-nucleotide amidase
MSAGSLAAKSERKTEHPTVALAESCTGGLIMSRIVAIPESGRWFKGGVVAYHSAVKFDLLAVSRGPVVTARAAEQMAEGVRRLLGAEIGVSTTGVAGPETEEGRPVGTVFVGIARPGDVRCHELHLEGGPDRIRAEAADFALEEIDRMGLL